MSPISPIPGSSGSSGSASHGGPGPGAAKKGRPRLSEPMKRKPGQGAARKMDHTPAKSASKARTRKGPQTPKKKRVTKGSNDDRSDSSDSSDYELEEVYEITYVDDFITAVDVDVEDMVRQNSRLMEINSEQVGWMETIEKEMTKLLGENDDELDPGRLSSEKRNVLKNLEDMLVQMSETGDRGVRTSDEAETIIEEKLRILDIDYKNLTTERAKHDPDTPKNVPNRSGNLKKPSINPTPRPKGTPSKTNLATKVDNNGDPKLTFPIALSTAGSASPAPSFSSSSSFDNKSGRDSQTPIDAAFLDDTRYRACKFKNPPTYVFPMRFPTTSNSSTPKKQEQTTQKKTEEDEGDKANDENDSTSKKIRTHSNSSQGSSSKAHGGNATEEDASDDSDSSSNSLVRSPEPKYCICEKISYGKMVQCDNELCPIEWFHFGCVHLKKIPKGNWFCPRCRGENSSVMKPKSEFLKELELYNKEKEKDSD